ncbi:gag-pol polyprotein [Cucumis melo var. makuwa]|uniref:Gag-pol polyprotein n=1 Tax=Cucumis melo var. makuwa TaxID=1194695 RepID=A0A5D3DV32_CUCMM|nr:gag-pol polyprotein [Cucumis melo var. makuwa]TYK27571.1 gag-pol polyprotein [Cucumis melo var. makuwa]
MISFLKTLDGRAWRAIVAEWEPPMITVDGHSVLNLKLTRLMLKNKPLWEILEPLMLSLMVLT